MMAAGNQAKGCYLGELLVGIEGLGSYPACLLIQGISSDSRSCKPGDLFMAVGKGALKVAEAVQSGACAILVEEGTQTRMRFINVPVVPVKDLGQKMGPIAARYYGDPSRQLNVIGVTGTNGKTSCSHILAQALPDCGLIGTLGYGRPNNLTSTGYTTPGPVELQKILAQLLHSGCKTVVMEVSSHALEQNRVTGTVFQSAIFTNLGRDHLDYHPDSASYGAAKAKLFRFPELKNVVINGEDAFGQRLLQDLDPAISSLSFGLHEGDLRCSHINQTARGLELSLDGIYGQAELHSGLFGLFNAENLLATVGLLLNLGYSLPKAAQMVAGAKPIPGRMQLESAPGKPRVFIDYAHNPSGLRAALESLRTHFPAAELFCLFGCGGDRDRGKRAEMARLAEALADRIMLTDDNPRNEDPDQICQEILAGFSDPSVVPVIHDRRAAIAKVIQQAGSNDLVLIAGKGAEQVQIIGEQEIPFLDDQVVRTYLAGKT